MQVALRECLSDPIKIIMFTIYLDKNIQVIAQLIENCKDWYFP